MECKRRRLQKRKSEEKMRGEKKGGKKRMAWLQERTNNGGKWGGRYCFALFSLCSLITNPKPEKQPVFLAVTQTH